MRSASDSATGFAFIELACFACATSAGTSSSPMPYDERGGSANCATNAARSPVIAASSANFGSPVRAAFIATTCGSSTAQIAPCGAGKRPPIGPAKPCTAPRPALASASPPHRLA